MARVAAPVHFECNMIGLEIYVQHRVLVYFEMRECKLMFHHVSIGLVFAHGPPTQTFMSHVVLLIYPYDSIFRIKLTKKQDKIGVTRKQFPGRFLTKYIVLNSNKTNESNIYK